MRAEKAGATSGLTTSRPHNLLRLAAGWSMDGEEEKEYLQSVADELMKYQVETASDEEEINYLKNIGLK